MQPVVTERPKEKLTMPKTNPKGRIEEVLALLNEELDETVKQADAEDSASDPQRYSALEDKVSGLNAAIYVVEQVQGWSESFNI